MSTVTEWEEFAASYLEAHPEISAAIPDWAEEVDFSEIGDKGENTEFSFHRRVGMVRLWGSGSRHADGTVHLTDDGAPDILIDERGEISTTSTVEAVELALSLATNLHNVANILNGRTRTLRRPADVDEQLMGRDV